MTNAIKFYQVLSRNNDVNGNPYRLTVCFNKDGKIVKLVESRDSMPNYHNSDEIKKTTWLLNLHLAPSEYNQFKKDYSELLVRDDY